MRDNKSQSSTKQHVRPISFCSTRKGSNFTGPVRLLKTGNDTEVSGVDLADAIDALRTESSAPIDQAPSLGCNIKWKKGNEPDYLG